jgi:hypothetical protein
MRSKENIILEAILNNYCQLRKENVILEAILNNYCQLRKQLVELGNSVGVLGCVYTM